MDVFKCILFKWRGKNRFDILFKSQRARREKYLYVCDIIKILVCTAVYYKSFHFPRDVHFLRRSSLSKCVKTITAISNCLTV